MRQGLSLGLLVALAAALLAACSGSVPLHDLPEGRLVLLLGHDDVHHEIVRAGFGRVQPDGSIVNETEVVATSLTYFGYVPLDESTSATLDALLSPVVVHRIHDE